MKLIKIIIDHTSNKVFGQSVTEEGDKAKGIHSVHEYSGFSDCKEAQKVVDNKSITIYDLRL
jgi:hypothetical protein